ncbi:HAD-IA family hydrolase [Aeromonas sp. 2HA2]|uniref:HAD-IA family hydrolase n=1 Tax=Aeromonas TaxID=642 RepID=UPI0023DD855B|nr:MULTISPECIES: HAD-IA family hydrolase [Aeromonas]MDF2409783.1 HAD-IA family hydrolase [Aeromonas sp. 2HA2]MDM5062876.1 HAD-IA family hydrolase [Aeromonas salmonicida]
MKYKIDDGDDILIISVDIFDTLLLRDGTSEEVRFYLIAKKISELSKSKKSNVDRIFYSRYKSHRWLYDLYEKKIIPEPSIDKVYEIQQSILIDPEIDKDLLLEAEIIVESNLLSLNVELADELLKQEARGKRIVLFSDMYLSSAIMRELLKCKGVKFNYEIFMSSEAGVSKHRGDAFSWLANRYGVSTANIHHLGDNYNSDYVNAQANKVKATLTPRSTFFYYKEQIMKMLGHILLKGKYNG